MEQQPLAGVLAEYALDIIKRYAKSRRGGIRRQIGPDQFCNGSVVSVTRVDAVYHLVANIFSMVSAR